MDIVLQQIVNAVSLGGIYALLALGLAVVFSIVSLINFAHGELMTVAGYGMFFAAAVSLPFPFAVLAAILFGALYQGGAELTFEIPGFSREMVFTLQGLIVLFAGAMAQVMAPTLARVHRALRRAPAGTGAAHG